MLSWTGVKGITAEVVTLPVIASMPEPKLKASPQGMPEITESRLVSALPLTVGFRRCEICALLPGADINSSFGLENVKGVVGKQVLRITDLSQKIR